METETFSHADIDAARAAYRQAEAGLDMLAHNVWVDGPATVDGLLPIVEEHGIDQAMALILEAPEQFAALRDHVTDTTYAESSDNLRYWLEGLVDAQERLDDLTAKHEAVLRAKDPSRLQVVYVGARPFEIDPSRGEVRSVENPAERYRLPSDIQSRETAPSLAKPSMTEHMAKEAGIEPAKPGPPQDRTRTR